MNSRRDVDAALTATGPHANVRPVMQIRVLTAVLTLLVVMPLGAQQPRWVGTWQLNPAKSSARAEPSPDKRVTVRIEPWHGALRVRYEMVGVRGGVTRIEWVGAMDGRPYPVQGVDYVMTNAYTAIDEWRYRIVVRVEGRQVAEAAATVSPDGRTLTVVTTEEDGRTTTAVYERRT